MLKILHGRLQHNLNQETPDIQAGFRKGRGTRDQIANIHWIIEKVRQFQKTICLCLINYAKALEGVNHDELWKALRDTGITNHLTCLLRNLFAGQEATVRSPYGTTDWFKIEKGVWQGCLLSRCLFNLCAQDIVRKARLDELQTWIKKGGWDINSIRYVDDITLMAESEEELKSLLMRVKESDRPGLKLTLKK